MVLSGCGEYDGKTAEQWSKMYYSENTEKVNLQNEQAQLKSEMDDLKNEKETLQNDNDDLDSENEELDEKYKKLSSCIEDNPHDAEDECL